MTFPSGVRSGGHSNDTEGTFEQHPTYGFAREVAARAAWAAELNVAQHNKNLEVIESQFATLERKSKLDPFGEKLAWWLKTESAKSRK